MKDEQRKQNSPSLNDIDIQSISTEQLLQKLNNINIEELTQVKIKGDGSCLYRSILVSLKQDENKFLELRNELSSLILKSDIDTDIIEERNCKNKTEFAEKVRNINFYADHPEIYLISKLLNIIIAIYNRTRDRWTIIKHNEVTKPIDIALLQFTESTH